jgi:hypothetical protein
MNNITLADFMNTDGVKKNLYNIDNFYSQVLDNPVITYCTFDASQVSKTDIASIMGIKGIVNKIFGDEYCTIPNMQSGGMNFSQVKQKADGYNEQLARWKFTNFYNPFSSTYDKYPTAKNIILAEDTIALGGVVCGAAIASVVPLLIVAVALSPTEYLRRTSWKKADGNLKPLEESLKKYDTFQENLKNATLEVNHFPKLEKEIAIIVKRPDDEKCQNPFWRLDYDVLNDFIARKYGLEK